jgi:hypothetical protein
MWMINTMIARGDANVRAAFVSGKKVVTRINVPGYDISMACINGISLSSMISVLENSCLLCLTF